jgi:glycosyltransferase involved in cell wall biosynthesis
MKILTVLTYYRPHTSGLTIYAERLSKAFVRRGHQVTVLTSQFDASLPPEEMSDGVRVVRAPVLMRISKGVIMPTFGILSNRLVAEHDVIHLHLPQFDAAGVALRGRLLKKPTVITYHCDLLMPPGLLSNAAMFGVKVVNNLAAQFTHGIVTYTRDYGENSPYLKRYLKKLHVIPPPVEMPEVELSAIEFSAQRFNPENRHPVIGMAARFASEKGVEVLLNALPIVLEKYPQALVLFAGPYQNIIGEEAYWKRLEPTIQHYQSLGNWKFVGNLNPEEMSAFLPNLDMLVVPSLNSTESFGLVQIEAMIHGVPSIASDLPGVRQPVRMHHMGEIIPIGDTNALARAICKIVDAPQLYQGDTDKIRTTYLPDSVAMMYEKLFLELEKS